MRNALINPDLFGNEAGDDEDIEVLNSYFLDKPEFDRFYSQKNRLAFVRSRKGMGKSALLRQALYSGENKNQDEIHLYLKASDLISIQEAKSPSSSDQLYAWQQRICTRINIELGMALKAAFSDDSIYLIEKAEVAGFRNRNIVSALFDRLNVKGGPISIDRQRLETTDSQAILTRVLDKKDVNVWLYIDDVDATFLNTENERIRVSTFFSACRNIVSNVNGLYIRASVRTDVWSIVASYDEALDKCEQYMLDLSWSTSETGKIMERKISSFIQRQYSDDPKIMSIIKSKDSGKIRGLVFNEPFSWSGRPLESFRPIHILSAGRPRWASQLCKMAGKDAYDKSGNRISMGHIRASLEKYGQFRMSDLYKEHRHQCAQLEDIIETFSGCQKRYTTSELLKHITIKIIKKRGFPNIDGFATEKGSISIAGFLYRIGFISGRDDSDTTGLGFVLFEDRPNLLSTTSNLDDGLDWEIHPCYRNVLRIKPGVKTDQFDI